MGAPNARRVPLALVVLTALLGEGCSGGGHDPSSFPYGPPPAPTAVPRANSVLLLLPLLPQPYARLDLYWSTAPGVTKKNGIRIANVGGAFDGQWFEHLGPERGRTYHYVLVGVLPDGRSSAESAEVSATVPYTTTFARLGPDGAQAWWHGVNDAFGRAIAARRDGSFCVTGLTHGPATFGAGEPNETTLRPMENMAGSASMFVAQYTADGLLSWVWGSEGAVVQDVAAAVLADGSVVVTGTYTGNLTLAPGTLGQMTLPQLSPASDVFVARVLEDGTLAWARSAGGWVQPTSGRHFASDAVGLSDGSVVVIGAFTMTITFPGPPDVTLTTTTGSGQDYDLFMARYDGSGQLLWAQRVGGSGVDVGLAIAPGPSDAITVAGGFDRTFAARYLADGSLAWAAGDRETYGVGGESIAAAGAGVVVAGGISGTTAVFGSGTPDAVTLPRGRFLARWTDDGTYSWARSLAVSVESYVAVAPAPGGEAWLVGTLSEPEEAMVLAPYLAIYAARYGIDGSLRAEVTLDRGPVRARGVAGLPDGSVIVLGNSPRVY